MAATTTTMTLGAVALRLGVDYWKVRRLFERGLLPPAARIGLYRVVSEADLPAIEAALRRAGYLGDERPTPTPSAA